MTPVYPTIKVYADMDSDGDFETDISAKVVSVIEGENGIFSNDDVERTSSTGSLHFDLRNDDYSYSNTILEGIVIEVHVLFGDREQSVFHATITSAKPDSGPYSDKRLHIVALDWFNVSHGTRVKDIPFSTGLSADEAIPVLLELTPNPPLDTDFEVGAEIFPFMFDSASKDTVVYSELDKITKSELGYLYLKFREGGEVLKLENYYSRSSTRDLSNIPESLSTPSLFKYHGAAGATGYLKYHGPSSTSGRIKLHSVLEASFEHIVSSDWESGKNVINEFTTTRTPRNIDVSEVVLYNLDAGIPIGTGQGIEINGSYSDPNGGTILSAFDIVVPAITTGYAFSEEPKGVGADLSANLIVTFTYGANGFHARIYNFSAPGYLWFFQVKGKALYKYNPVDYIVENVKSKEDIVKTVKSSSITREYSSDYNTSKIFSDSVVALNALPRKELKSVTFIANYSEALLSAFMYLEQGDKVEITDNVPDHTGKYYIQGVKFTISTAGIIYFTWYLKEAIETIAQPIAVKNATYVSGKRNAIDFGILPNLVNLRFYSYSLWVKRLDTASAAAVLISHCVDTGTGRRGNFLILANADVELDVYKTPTDGRWIASSCLPANTNWHHLVVTYDNTTDAADPRFYVDGALATVTELATPVGTTDDNSDCPLVLFNMAPDPAVVGQRYFYGASRNVVLKNVRIYNHILSAADIATLYASPDDYSIIQDGLLFNGIHASQDNIDEYVGDTIDENDYVLDTVQGAAGVPYNEDTTDSTTMLGGVTP